MTHNRLVFDSNCYFAAALSPTGYMHQWLEQATSGRFHIYTSPEILAELQDKLETKLGYTARQSVDFRLYLEEIATVVHPAIRLKVVRDPDDNKVLECAVEAKAVAIVTFDKDLLDLKEYADIKMVNPSMIKYWFTSE